MTTCCISRTAYCSDSPVPFFPCLLFSFHRGGFVHLRIELVHFHVRRICREQHLSVCRVICQSRNTCLQQINLQSMNVCNTRRTRCAFTEQSNCIWSLLWRLACGYCFIVCPYQETHLPVYSSFLWPRCCVPRRSSFIVCLPSQKKNKVTFGNVFGCVTAAMFRVRFASGRITDRHVTILMTVMRPLPIFASASFYLGLNDLIPHLGSTPFPEVNRELIRAHWPTCSSRPLPDFGDTVFYSSELFKVCFFNCAC